MSPSNRLMDQIILARADVVLADGSVADPTLVTVQGFWEGGAVRPRIVNASRAAITVREVVLADVGHDLPADTPVFGEGFQKLAQTGGSLADPTDLGSYPDRTHYRIQEPDGLRTAYGMLLLSPADEAHVLVAATSCERFITRFSFSGARIRISFDCENLVLPAGGSWLLEEVLIAAHPDRLTLLDQLTESVSVRHPRLEHELPGGWSSWLCFGPDVTAADVEANAVWISENLPTLKYVQIDDGYQPWMGDWLEVGEAFGGDVQGVLRGIRDAGLIPSMWVAPFIASPQSRLLAEHPDWFVKGEDGSPLDSSAVGFGGWRQGPWYVLDGTHPDAQDYLTTIFRTMREEWGVGFFKLDAAYWGAIHGGRFFDPAATRIEAYRRGMEAIRRGAGDAFLLGCNHPIWPSLGLIHGSRSSNDVLPSWDSFRAVSIENNHRIWQNGRLWWNDPDTIVLSGRFADSLMGPDGLGREAARLTENELHYHVASAFAIGGLILSGDDLPNLPPARAELLRRVAEPTGVSIRFADDRFETGRIPLPDGTVYALFNREDQAAMRTIQLPAHPVRLTDYLTGEDCGIHAHEYTVSHFPPRFAQLLTASDATTR